MSARDNYPKLHAGTSGPHHQGQTSQEAQAALDEIDQLRGVVADFNPYRHDHNPLNADFHGGSCPACEWWSELIARYPE